jgi:hypothetical protein
VAIEKLLATALLGARLLAANVAQSAEVVRAEGAPDHFLPQCYPGNRQDEPNVRFFALRPVFARRQRGKVGRVFEKCRGY